MSNKQNSVIVSLALLIIINFSGSALATNTIIEDLKITVGERRFTESIAISDDYVIMGSWGSSAYIYKKESTGWIQQDRLTGSSGSTYDRHFGCAVSINGDYAIVGASTDSVNGSLPGSAYIFKRIGTNWVEQINIVPNDGGGDDRFGTSVSIFGDYAIVGSEYHNHLNGAAYIFKRDGENWIQHTKLTASFGYDSRYVYFGRCVSLSANYAVVRGKNDVYIYKNDGKNWIEQTRLTDSSCTSFGNQFAISGDYLLITASANNESFAWVYQNGGENWIKQAKLMPENLTQKDFFGWNLSLSNDYAIISSTDNDIGDTAYIFQRDGERWIEKAKLISSDSYREIDFGQAVAISNEYAIVGAGASYIADSNAAYIYHAPFDDRNSRTIKPLPPTNGQILPSSCIAVPYSDNQAFSIIPDSGYKIFDVKVDEKSVGAVSSYTFYNITENHIINASFVLSDAVFVTENGKNVLPDDISSSSIKAYGDYLIIGSGYYNSGDGIAYILKRNDMDWVIQSTLLPDGGPDLFTDYKDQFGYSVSIEENFAVVGAAYDDNNIGGCPGSVYVYKREDNTWSQQTKLTLPNGTLYDNFGWKVAVFGDHIIAATAESNKSNVYYFKRNGEYWVLQNQALHFSEYVTDLFLTENYAFVSMTKEGYVYIYELQNENWIEIDRLRSPDYQEYDYFGSSLAVFNDYVFVGATRGDSNQADTGAVYVYKKGTYRWVYQEKLVAKDAEQYDQFGNALAIASTRSGDYLFVGARSDKFDFLENTGSVYSFKFDGNNWVEQSKLIISDGKEYEMLGTSIFTSDQYAFVFKDKDFMMFDYAESAIYSYVYPFNGQSADEAPQFYQESSDIEMQTHGNTEITVSDANGGILTICAESSNETIIPNAFISLSGSGSNIYSINTRSDMPQVLSMTFFQTSTHYGDISIHVMITDATGLTATQSFSVRVEPYQCLDCNDDNKDCTRFDIVAAGDHFLILKPDGTVWGWGNNYFGQLGNGFFDFFLGNVNPSHSSHWLQVQNLSDVVAISASSHNLALRSDGSVWSWGFNNRGQLGNGNNTDQNIPVQVINLTDVIDIACGYFHSLAIKNDGTVWAWGYNVKGQLGVGDTVDQNIPVQVKYLQNVVAISAGVDHSMALRSDGTVWTWGLNNSWQLGYTDTEFQVVPRQVKHLDQVIRISTEFAHCLALRSDGTVWAWGRNIMFQLGNENISNQSDPVQVQGLSDIQYIESGAYHNFALKNDGTVWAWGSNYSGELGNSTVTENKSFKPVLVQNIDNIIAVSSGDNYQNLALSKDGRLWMWGFRSNLESLPAFQKVLPDAGKIKDISSTDFNSYAVLEDGSVWHWGEKNYGQLIDENIISISNPSQLTELHQVIAIESTLYTENFSLALKSDGTVWSWGGNANGQLGNGTTQNSTFPVQVINIENVIEIVSGKQHSLAVKSDGSLWAWGANENGQLGDGTQMTQNIPVHSADLMPVKSVAAGEAHSVALKQDGTVWAWGANNNGQLGDGTTIDRHIPVQVSGLTNIISISSAMSHNLALKEDGSVWFWGTDDQGNHNIPICLLDLHEIVSIETEDLYSIAQSSDGKIWAWGKIWNNHSLNDERPIQLPQISDMSYMTCGHSHFNVFMNDGSVFTWGLKPFDRMPQKIGELPDNSGSVNICSTISIENIQDQTTNEDISIDIPVSISHAENDPFTMTVVSENPFLVIDNGKTSYDNQNQVILTITPAPNHNGQTKIIVYVTNSKGHTARSDFVLTILPINDSPDISLISDQTITTTATSFEYPYTVFDVESYYTELQNSVTSSNLNFIPDHTISINGTEKNRKLLISNVSGQGTTDIYLTTTDADGLTTVSMFTFCVNYSPVVRGKEVVLDEDRYLNILLEATDSDQNQLSYTMVNQPANGTVSIIGDIATYTPNPNFNGLDRFSFMANDGVSNSNEGNIILTIYPVNDPPIAQDFSINTTENTSCTFVLPETDVDGDTISSNIIKQPKNGYISGSLQHYTYTPNEWFWGTDTMVYNLTDGQMTSLTATITFIVNQAEAYTLSLISSYGFAEMEINETRVLLPWEGSLPAGSEITLNAISTSDQVFEKWSDNINNPTANPATFILDRSKTIMAHFSPPRKTLRLIGHHTILINDQNFSLPYENTYYQGTHLTLKASPEGSFNHWSGDLTGSDNPIEIDIQSDMIVGVLFDDSDEWLSTILAETVDLSDVYTDTVTIGVSALSKTEIEQLSSEYACSLLVYSPEWQKFSTDIRASGASEFRWILAVNPHGNIGPPDPRAIVLSWDPAHFNDTGSFRMYSGYDQVDDLVISDMRNITAYEVIGGDSVQYFTIVWSSQLITNVHLNMQTGWNLISLPVIPENPHINNLFPDITSAYAFKNGAYFSVDQLENGKGYWIKTSTSGYDISGEPFQSYSLTLDQGWHLIGALINPIDNLSSNECVEVMYGYQNGSYALASELIQGKGYWIKVKENCIIKLGSVRHQLQKTGGHQ